MDAKAAFDLYIEGQDAYNRGDLSATLDAWQKVLDLFQKENLLCLEAPSADIPKEMLLGNLAGVSQAAKRWSDMRRYAELLVADDRDAKNLQLLATALKNEGDPQRAREVIEEAVRLDPHCAHAHHEHACILAAAGELDEALHAMERAIAAGSSPQSLLNDDELAMMKDVPGFDRVMSAERHVEGLLARLSDLSAMLGSFQTSSSWGHSSGVLSDAEIELFDEAVGVTRTILGATFSSDAPRDAQGRIILASCSDLQRNVIETFLTLEPLWKAIPFLNLIGEIGVPNTTVHDARRELRLRS